eukprot:m.63920 g.63920  ORF g.63920 m.63920 type:complete len:620 (+) comp23363_c0_seq1:186-2045(+)
MYSMTMVLSMSKLMNLIKITRLSFCFGVVVGVTGATEEALNPQRNVDDSGGIQWWTESTLTKMLISSPANTSQCITIASQRGELEAYQIGIRTPIPLVLDPTKVQLQWNNGSPEEGVTLNAFKVIHFYCNQSQLYNLEGNRWLPDGLMPIDTDYFTNGVYLEPNVTHTIWVRLSVLSSAPPGVYQGTITFDLDAIGSNELQHVSVPLNLTVWNVTIPSLSSPSSLGTVFAFNYGNHSSLNLPADVGSYYPTTGFTGAVRSRYFNAMSQNRLSLDTCYLKTPRSIDDYTLLASEGVRYFGILDVSTAGSDGKALTNYTDAQIAKVLELLAPTVESLRKANLLRRAYVYGFDERPQTPEWAAGINQMFGAVKQRYPDLRTMAAIRWKGSDATTPLAVLNSSLDIFVQLYSLWNETDAAAWRAFGGDHETWAYHCISPRPSFNTNGSPGPMRWLNTWLESQPMESRLLPWWAASANVSGWLYYSTNLWTNNHKPPYQAQLKPLVLRSNSSVFTDFSPIIFNGAADPHNKNAFSNGDGLLLYPGVTGPITSIRLENFRDGIEDYQMLQRLSEKARVSVIGSAIKSRTGWPYSGGPIFGVNITVNSSQLDTLRRSVAMLIEQAS